MSALGIGTRVYIKWGPRQHRQGDAEHIPCSTGTITEGPFAPGEVSCRGAVNAETVWGVNVDGHGDAGVGEGYLTPIDDDDERALSDELEEAVS